MSTQKKSFGNLKDLKKHFGTDFNKLPSGSHLSKTHGEQVIPTRAVEAGKKTVFVKFHPNFKSVRVDGEKFSNHLEDISESQYCSRARKIFSFENQEVKYGDLCFELDEDGLKIKPKHVNILNECGVYNGESDNEISKSTYTDSISKDHLSSRKSLIETRVFFKLRKKSLELEIILVDLYHLFATNDKKKINETYSKVKGYQVQLNDLRSDKVAPK